ncbi:calmin isoform X1 [Balaenoptera musculus]|uniref:Calmin n=2 Tax=Balaenoptera musculus TaxID=9771 RepID=A0A8B8WLD2_BALMU|nr:calmin isoform X1 [Balaenoptera musculus]XP_036698058.1 calmin isoform X1 [Balaenoptera musculus]
MAAHEWDWFQREELIGQISDIRVQNLQVERENVQKRTFTRWINLHLEKCNPPLEVKDLFVDIQDGKILMALLEVLSGRNLLHEYKSSSHRIFRLNNIAKALKFLEDSNVKLVSIDAAEIADGNPSLVLGLIWNIILFFQIKELTGNLSRNSPSSSLSPGSGGTDSDSCFPPTPTAERSAVISVKDQRKAIRTLLTWVQRKTRKYGVAVQDFAGSWRSGLAFLAVIKAIDPSLVDMKLALEDSMRENLEKAFSIAHDALHIPRLLEPEDIMVDTPDEQSIVTYVAQFLEHFPELEAEDFADSDKEAPIESTFVRIRETPSEQESTVFLLTENGERAYTVNHETSHPPPSKVFVCDKPEDVKEPCVTSPELADSSSEFMHQIVDQVLQGTPGKINSTSELAPESSILSSTKDNQRSNSLPIKKTVHFEADTYKDASCSRDPFYSPDLRFEGSPRETKESSRQDGQVLAAEVAEETLTQEAPEILEAASSEAPSDVSLVDGKVSHPPTSQTSPSWNGASERAASPGEEGRSPSSLGEDTIVADSMEIKVKLLTVEAMDKEDSFEGIPLKASKFNSDLVDFPSTSQAFHEVPSPHEKTPAEEEVSEDRAEKLGKRRGKSAHRKTGLDEPPVKPNQQEPHKDPGPEDQGYSLAPEEAPVDKKPEVYEKAKHKSPRRRRDEEEGEAEGPRGLGGELPSNPPSSSVSLETLHSPSEESLDFKPSPPLSRISIIPHDFFYYPHYEIPLAAVLEAYAEGVEDLKNEEVDLEEPEGYLPDLGAREEEAEEAEASQSSCSFRWLGKDHPQASIAEDARPASEPTPPSPQEDHQPREAAESVPMQGHQSQELPNSENLANPLEEKVMEEPISSKKKEKRKHVDHVESSIFIAPGTIHSSDDLEEDTRDHKVLSRTSHSDSSIYIRRHANRSLESEHFNYAQLRNAADLDDRRNRMLTRYNTQKLTELILQFYGIRTDMKRECKHARMSMKANNSGEAKLQEIHSPQSDSLMQFVQQPDVMYFILFLWLLVYCLLLFPQLDINRL